MLKYVILKLINWQCMKQSDRNIFFVNERTKKLSTLVICKMLSVTTYWICKGNMIMRKMMHSCTLHIKCRYLNHISSCSFHCCKKAKLFVLKLIFKPIEKIFWSIVFSYLTIFQQFSWIVILLNSVSLSMQCKHCYLKIFEIFPENRFLSMPTKIVHFEWNRWHVHDHTLKNHDM